MTKAKFKIFHTKGEYWNRSNFPSKCFIFSACSSIILDIVTSPLHARWRWVSFMASRWAWLSRLWNFIAHPIALYSQLITVSGHVSSMWRSASSLGMFLNPHLLLHSTGNLGHESLCGFFSSFGKRWAQNAHCMMDQRQVDSTCLITSLRSTFSWHPQLMHCTSWKEQFSPCFFTSLSSPVHEQSALGHLTFASNILRWQATSEKI